MDRAIKLGIAAFVVAALAVLSYAAVSDDMFFIVQQLKPEDYVHDEVNGYSLPFYKDGGKVEAARMSYNTDKSGDNQAVITFQLSHRFHFIVDSMQIEFKMLPQPSALKLENPAGLPPLPAYTTTVDDSSVTFHFPNLGSQGSRTLNLYFWLDLSQITSDAAPVTLELAFSMHEESVFKIVKQEARVAVNLDIQSVTS